MKLQLSILLLLLCNLLLAQAEDSQATALKFHEKGKTFLQQDSLFPFAQIQALDQFQQSQKILHINNIEATELESQNAIQIQHLLALFVQYHNRDSLLELTQFYPDSVFQANSKYTNEFKVLIQRYLTVKSQATRKAFFKCKNLNYFDNSGKATRPNSILTFENYWPLEVLAFEKWLKENENSLSAFPNKAQKELLYLRLQNQMDALNNDEITDYYQSNSKQLVEKLERTEKEKELAKSNYNRLKNIGLGLLGLLLAIGYFLWQKNSQLLKSKNQSLMEEKRRSDDLLSNILPTEVVRQLKNKETTKARRYNAVGVLFTDFKNFSQISKNLPPEELVRELDYCFSAFDRIIEKYHLQKIKTIGDAYMCVGGLYTKGDSHIPRMVAAALEIQQFLISRKRQRETLGSYFFEARIGIHTGPVVAGIIGTNKYAFDVWGDTVNAAQQMEQHSEVGKVNISGETYELVKDKFDCTHRGEITVKNEKVFDMYFVDRKVEN